MAELHKIWIEQFEAAENIEDDFGTQKALEYLIGDKFLNFLEAAENDKDFVRKVLPTELRSHFFPNYGLQNIQEKDGKNARSVC
jgi:hypothetical protein